ncbi:MAG: HlyD family secretion protein [Betaproteobacteria bacterium HGW-Betaproteobacteria-18]|nr:MAG: HlyD family secretion protein [Betaproteobacteria bacterium HGW-Betaproteobacteria-18]
MKILALLILAREDSFSDEERQTCKALADVYGHALGALKITRPFYSDIRNLAARFKLYYILAAVFIVLFFIPVRQSSLGTAEVTPLIYSSISSSLDGVIAKVLVKPNEQVKKGQPLFRMDDTTIRNRLESAHRTMGVAKSEEFTSRQKAFVDPQSRAELATQEARVKEKSSTIGYMQELLGKMVVTAPENGVILFSDPADLEGRPITTGERVMTLADDNSASMTVWLATSDAVALEPGRRVRLFLHTQPLNPCEGFILSSSYQPVTSPEGIASYRVTAVFADGELRPRLGLRGTAKIYGERVRLGYYLFRRPIAAVRQWLGW